MDLNVLRNISYGVYALTVNDNNRATGCIINTLIQVTSFEPFYMAVCLNKESYTNEVLKRTGKYCVNLLSEQTPRDVIQKLGFSSGRSRDKMTDIKYELSNGLPNILENCCGFLQFEIHSITDVFTHEIIIGKLTDSKSYEGVPMTYKYYHEIIKGKAPKSAPTFLTNN